MGKLRIKRFNYLALQLLICYLRTTNIASILDVGQKDADS